jgi:hypothetical protein
MAVHSKALMAFPTVVPFFQVAKKRYLKLNFLITALELLFLNFVAS